MRQRVATSRPRSEKAALKFLERWNNICAVCAEGEQLVLDHDHKSALIRGYLCPGCNRREAGKDESGVFEKYRRLNPATMLGIRVYYYGGWSMARPEPDLTAEELRDAVDRINIAIPPPSELGNN